MSVSDFFPHECINDDDVIAIIEKLDSKGISIKENVDGTVFSAPYSVYRNCSNWAVLSDGSALLWNESPRSGYGFKHVGVRGVENYYNKFLAKLPDSLIASLHHKISDYDRFQVGMTVTMFDPMDVSIGKVTIDTSVPARVIIDDKIFDSRTGEEIMVDRDDCFVVEHYIRKM